MLEEGKGMWFNGIEVIVISIAKDDVCEINIYIYNHCFLLGHFVGRK
jgi:hypothetical protein